MRGMVTWYHQELRVALIDRAGGFTVGTVGEGLVTLGDMLAGDMCTLGVSDLVNERTGRTLRFELEAEYLTEEEATDLVGFIRN